MIYTGYKLQFSMGVLNVCLLPCFNGALAYQERGFLFRGIGLSLALVLDWIPFNYLFVGGIFFLFPLVLLLLLGCWPLYCIFFVMVSGLT